MTIQITSVVQPRQAISHSHLDGLGQTGAQSIIVALAPNLSIQARNQLLLVDRAHQIVIDAQLKAANKSLVLSLISYENDRNEPRTIKSPQLRAEAQRIVSRQ